MAQAQRQNDRFYQRRAPVPPKTPPPPKKEALQIHGAEHLWTNLQIVKDPASGATKTTRAMEVPGGVIVNTCTRGAGFAADALVFVPGAGVLRDQVKKTGVLVPKS